jgi:hypothetical protein
MGDYMSERGPEGTSALTFAEIKTGDYVTKYKYRSAKTLSLATIILGGVNCVFALAQISTLLNQWQLLEKMGNHLFQSKQDMMSVAAQSDQMVMLASRTFLFTLILTYIVGGLWIYRAARNIRAAGARGLENTPGWTVGWYFVPFMSLFKPFGAMVEIWNGSLSPEQWKTLPVPGLLRWWWGLWLATNAFGWSASVIAKSAKTIPSLISLTQFQMFDSAMDIASTIMFLMVVLQVTRMQTETSATANELAAAFS